MRNIERWILPVLLVVMSLMKWPGAWLAFTNGKWLALHFAAVAFIALAVWRGPRLPKLRTWQAALVLGVFAGSLAHLFWFSPRGYEFTLMDRLSFVVLCLGAWEAFRSRVLKWEDFWWPLALTILAVSAFGMWQMWEIGFPGAMPYLKVGSTFGHTNTTAQFIGLALLIWWGIPRPKVGWWFQPALSAFALTYFFFLRGRSTIVALALGLLLLAVWKARARQLKVGRGFALALGIVVVLFAGLQLVKGKSWDDLLHFRILAEKSSMMQWRADVWKQTVAMIKSRPLGVGADRFVFEFIPYHGRGSTNTENGLADTPHNEILRYLAEDGVILASFYFLLLAGIFAFALKRRVKPGPLIPAMGFLAVEAVFQFPFIVPFPALVLALAIGWVGAQLWPVVWQPGEGKFGRMAAAPALVLVLMVFTKVVIARSYEWEGTLEQASLSCRMVPRNWKSCLTKARLHLEKGELLSAREAAEDILFNDPWNYTAMRYLSLIAFRQGDRLEGCFYLWRYDQLFYSHSSVHDKLIANCPKKFLSYFELRRPLVYMVRYNQYLARPKPSYGFWE